MDASNFLEASSSLVIFLSSSRRSLRIRSFCLMTGEYQSAIPRTAAISKRKITTRVSLSQMVGVAFNGMSKSRGREKRKMRNAILKFFSSFQDGLPEKSSIAKIYPASEVRPETNNRLDQARNEHNLPNRLEKGATRKPFCHLTT